MTHAFTRSIFKIAIAFSLVLAYQLSSGATITTTGSGSWSSTTPNAPWPGGTIPASTDDIVIGTGFTLTVDGNRTCNSMTVGNGSTLSVSSSVILTVTAGVSFPNLAGANVTGTLNGSGTISAATMSLGGTVTPTSNQTTIITSTVSAINLSSNLTLTSQRSSAPPRTNDVTFQLQSGTVTVNGILQSVTGASGGTSTVTLATGAQSGTLVLSNGTPITTSGGGTSTFTFTGTSATVNYSGAAQTVFSTNYTNLILSGSGTKTLQAGTTSIGGNLQLSGTVSTTTVVGLGVTGNLDIGDGTSFTAAGFALTVTGTTSVGGGTNGQLSITSATGTKTFTGLVTVSSGATWTNNTANSPVTFNGGITNSGTFNAGSGVHTFSTSSQQLTGTLSIPSVTVTGVTLTNNNTLTVGTALSGTGGLTQASNSTLNIGGTSGITTLTATNNGNTVNFTGAAQTINNNNYYNLSLSGSGTKTLQTSMTSISGTFTLGGTASATCVAGLTIGGTITLGSGTSFTAGAFTHAIGGDWINNGSTISTTNSTINLNGTTQNLGGTNATSFNNLALSGSGTKTFSFATTISGNLSVSSGVVANLGTFTTHTANTLNLGGAHQLAGTWGSSSSAATHQDDTFFSATSGYVTIATVITVTYYSRANGAWNASSTWSTVGFASSTNTGSFPIAGDIVNIGGGFTVTVTADAACSTLGFDTGNATNTVSLNSGVTLSASGTITIGRPGGSNTNTLAVNSGTVNAASDIAFTNAGSGSAKHLLTISTGTVNVTGNITQSGGTNSPTITFTGAGTLNLAGGLWSGSAASGTLNTATGCTVNYNGAAQTVTGFTTYVNLTLSGSGTKTLQSGMTSIAGNLSLSGTASATTVVGLGITGNLNIGNGTSFTVAGFALTVTGTTTVGGGTSGQLSITSATGTKTFTGLVTVSNGATWTNSTANSPVTFSGGITNNGTFNAGTGVHTFSTNSQQLTGAFSIPSVTVTGVTLTNNNTLTVSNALSGTGGLTQAANSTLNLSGTSGIATLTASNSGNTVNYNGSSAQTVKLPASSQYANLSFNGTGTPTTATLPATVVNVSGNWINNATGSVSPNGGTITFNGISSITGTSTTSFNNLTVTGTLTSASGTINVTGTFTNNGGTFNHNNGTVNFTGLTSIAGSTTTNFYNLIVSSGNLTGPLSGTINVGHDLTITGNYIHNGGTIVFNGGAQSITGANATATNFNSVTINSGSTLTPPTSFNINSTLQNDGTFVAGTGMVNFTPTSGTATISGTSKITFYNITVADGGAATDLILENSAGADLSNILDVGFATFDADGAGDNRTLTLLSTADKPTQDASIAPIFGAVTGKVTVQRYANRAGVSQYDFQVYRDISSPVNTTVWDFQQSLPVTGPFLNPSTVTQTSGGVTSTDPAVLTNVASLVKYNEPTAGNLSNGWIDFPASGQDSHSVSFDRGQGYSTFIFGVDDPVDTTGNAKWTLTGDVWQGSFDLPVSYTPTSGGTSNDGWNLVGNPFPSTIDWQAAGWTKTNIDDAIYIDDYSTANPVYASFVNGVWSDPSRSSDPGYIASGQGFWVKANASGPVLTIDESVKVAGSQTILYRTSPPKNLVYATLSGANNMTDHTAIYFSDSSSAEFDKKCDALKRPNQYGYLNLSSLSPLKQKFSINAMPFSNCTQTVGLDVSNVTNGTYTFSFSNFETMPASMSIQLKDAFKNTTTDVRANSTYSFTVSTTNKATYGSARFSITFNYQGGSIPLSSLGSAVCDPSLSKITVTNSSTDFNYQVYSSSGSSLVVSAIQGTGSDLDLFIPSDKLVSGTNSFIVKESNRYCGGLDATASVSVSYVPAPTSAPTASSSLSCGQGSVTLTALGAPTDGYYNWYDSQTATQPIPSQTSAAFNTPSLTKSAIYYVSVANSLGCESQRTPVTANIVIQDPAVITVLDLFTLQSNYSTGNQWYVDEQIINGATSQTIKPTKTGLYLLEVTSPEGCRVTTEKEFVVTAIENGSFGSDTGIKVYPNPVNKAVKIEINGIAPIVGEIFNTLGVKLTSLNFQSQGSFQAATHDFASSSAGVYILRVEQNGQVKFVRIIKE